MIFTNVYQTAPRENNINMKWEDKGVVVVFTSDDHVVV